MTKKPVIIIVIVAITSIIILAMLMWINGTPWDKKSAKEEFSAILQEHFGDVMELERVEYSWKAERYEAYAVDTRTQTKYRVIFSEIKKGDCFYMDMSTEKTYIMPIESAYESAKNRFINGEIYYQNFLNCINTYDDIIYINNTLQNNSYVCNNVGGYYCYSNNELIFDDNSADTIIAFMQKTQSERIEFYDTHIQVLFDYEGALYQESIVYYYDNEKKSDIGENAFCGKVSDNWYYVLQVN